MKRKIFIGTSGWAYKDWAEKFYPPKFKNKLDYYAKYFNTVEVNATFYRLPQRKVFKQWKKITGPDFIFSIKISRYISHRKRLKTDEEGKVAIKN
ncbi:MAG TPA: DUF72 domain-containing protein, partial [Patescibacteria group bacterium]|nr:DUF72 domain-containing protein [Patescibacteria group bacterium]